MQLFSPSLAFAAEDMSLDTIGGMTKRLTRDTTPFVLPSVAAYQAMDELDRELFDFQRRMRMNDLVINTPAVQDVVMNVRRAVINNEGRTTGRGMVMVSGEATMGKTTAVGSAIDLIGAAYTQQFPNWIEQGLAPIVYVDVPPSPHGRQMMGRFANFFGIPVRAGDTLEDLKRMVVPILRDLKTKLIVIEEVHGLKVSSTGNSETIDTLKGLANQVSATFVLSGINIHDPKSGIFAGDRGQQIAGRSTISRLQPFTTANTAEWEVWNKVIKGFASQLGLFAQTGKLLVKHTQYLHDRTKGRLADLGRLLTVSAQILVEEQVGPAAEVLTPAIMDRVALTTDSSA